MLTAAALVLAQAVAAWSGARPPECAESVIDAPNAWERAKSPERRHYCDLVASASSKLAGTAEMAQTAYETAREAEGVLPGHAAPEMLKGLALAALGNLSDAFETLKRAKDLDPRCLDDPPALFAWARVLARTGRAAPALEAYRALLPRASSLSSADRSAAATEAGLVALAAGPRTLDESIASFREAVRSGVDDTEPVAELGLALALDRRGDVEESRAIVRDRAAIDPRAVLSSSRARELLAAAPSERAALLAMGLEAVDAARASEAWRDYLDRASTSPWADHARARLASLRIRESRPHGTSGR
ncbi:MAG: hypothetical protein ABSC94_07990 [Polyangiaceae bacterium]|jgi:tetratricopeptide (TPR) repeat protein